MVRNLESSIGPGAGGPTLGVVGASGMVGRQVVDAILERKLVAPEALQLFASQRREFKTKHYTGEVPPVEKADFSTMDLCLFATEEEVSKRWIPQALADGARVVDASSWKRLCRKVPLIVPGVNDAILQAQHPMCAQTNCIVSPLACVLAPLQAHFRFRRIFVATYQSVSGAGQQGMEACRRETEAAMTGQRLPPPFFPREIGLNVIPEIGAQDAEGIAAEERKIQDELQRVLQVHCPIWSTTVRVPVLRGHACALWVEFEDPWDLETALVQWRASPMIHLADTYDTPRDIQGRETVSLGRLRNLGPHHMGAWVCSDNLLRGAALDLADIAALMLAQEKDV